MYINNELFTLEALMNKLFLVIFISTLVLAACGDNKEELRAFYTSLEETIEIESEIEELSQSFNNLEEEKRQRQDEINTADRETLSAISADLLEKLDEQVALIEREQTVMEESRESMLTTESLVEDIPSEMDRLRAEQLIEDMTARYEAHSEMREAYTDVFDTERELFELYDDDDLSQEQVDTLLEELREDFKVVEEKNNAFQQATANVNEKKEAVLNTINN